MSDYDMTFDKKIVDDKSFDTIFGGEEDDHLLDLILKEDADAFNIDERDPEGVEDGLGKIGAGKGLGSDVGPDHDENKPTDDTSDIDILVSTDKDLKSNDQLNVSDTTGEKVHDGGMVNTNDVHASGTDEVVGNDPTACERHLDDAIEKVANKVDGFDEAYTHLLEDLGEELPEEVAPAPVAPATAPAAEVPAPAPEAVPATPAAPEVAQAADAPVAATVPAADDTPSDLDLLDTDPVDDGPVEEAAEESKDKEEEKPITADDLDKEEVEEAAEESKDKEEVEEAADPVNPDDVKDKVDMGGVEDKSGKIGAGEGLGNDLGPDHDTANKPTDDTSDMDVLTNSDSELKNDQLNVSDTTGEKVEDGGMVKDFANAGEDGKNASDSFKEASIEDLENAPEEEEDEIIDAVEGNKEKSEYSVAELNADDDDEILDMLT